MICLHIAMEVVVTEDVEFSSRFYSSDFNKQISEPSDAVPRDICVHQNQHKFSTNVDIVDKYDHCVTDTQEQISAVVMSQHTLTAENELSVNSTEDVPLTSQEDSYTTGSDVAVDSQSTSTKDCAMSCNTVTTKLADCDIGTEDHSTVLAKAQCISRPQSLYSAKKSVCFPADDTDNAAEQRSADDDDRNCVIKQESKRMSLLLRLFESKLFDIAIALPYLFNSKEPGVLAYLG